MAKLIKIDKNGTKYFEEVVACDRCGGAGGADQWAYTGWTCYKCGGTGKQIDIRKEYTPEYEQKLADRRQKRKAKYEQEIATQMAKAEEERKRIEAEAERIEAEERAEKEKSNYIGTVGDKIETDAIYKCSAWFECPAYVGFGTETKYIHTFKVGDNTVVWKTTNGLGIEKGTQVTIKGTIKEHTEYRGEKQTILTRCRVKA